MRSGCREDDHAKIIFTLSVSERAFYIHLCVCVHLDQLIDLLTRIIEHFFVDRR